MCVLPLKKMRLWPLKHTSASSSLQFRRQRGDAPGVRPGARDIRKIIMISLYALVSSCPGCLWRASVSMGVIRRVGLASQLTRCGRVGEERGWGGWRPRSNNPNRRYHHHHHEYLQLWGDVASCQTAEGSLFAYNV